MNVCTDQIAELGIAIPWPLQDYTELAAVPAAVSRARKHTRKILAEWHLNGQAAELIVSELVTNAIVHGGMAPRGPAARLWLSSDGERVLVQVWDRARQMPALRDVQPEAVGGRGLVLVNALSEDWGAYRPARLPGKIVWSVIAVGMA
jgi:anti-sigma regulatory factor (Ser/Thr protein kinase)